MKNINLNDDLFSYLAEREAVTVTFHKTSSSRSK